MTICFDDLIGIPYKEHGRSTEEGFDCYGLVIEVLRRNGKHLNDVWYENHALTLADENIPLLNIYPVEIMEPGTLLEMEYMGNLHIGIAVNSKEFLHATKKGVRINRIGCIKIIGMYNVW